MTPRVSPDHAKRLRKAMGIVGAKDTKRFRRWLKHSKSPQAQQARIAIAAQMSKERRAS